MNWTVTPSCLGDKDWVFDFAIKVNSTEGRKEQQQNSLEKPKKNNISSFLSGYIFFWYYPKERWTHTVRHFRCAARNKIRFLRERKKGKKAITKFARKQQTVNGQLDTSFKSSKLIRFFFFYPGEPQILSAMMYL